MLERRHFQHNNAAMAQGYEQAMAIVRYSHYPTNDKKYECRTGPFEGFFVSSVEFCKHVKFDDNKDDRKITKSEIIEQEHKVHPVHKALQVHKVHKDQKVTLEQQEQQEQENWSTRHTRNTRFTRCSKYCARPTR